MEEIHVNDEQTGPASSQHRTNQRGARSSERRRPGCVVLSLGLLSVSLLAGLIGLGVTYGDLLTHSSTVQTNLTERLQLQNANLTERLQLQNASLTERLELQNANLTECLQLLNSNLTERLQASREKLSSVSAERDKLNARLAEQSRELERLRAASRQKKSCPEGWTMFRCSCYLLVTQQRTWEKARDFCTTEEAHLVTIDDLEEQTFVAGKITGETWIGLNDREQEGTYKWTDGSPLTQTFWSEGQPDNGNPSSLWGEEDCMHLEGDTKKWNDRRCDASMHFICEKTA